MISLVICSIDPARFDRVTEQYRRLLADEPHEIIGIHDAVSLAEGYNRALAKSRGDLILFSHDDVEIWTPDFIPRLKRHLEQFDAVGVAGTTCLIGATWFQAGPPNIFGQVTHIFQNKYQVHIYGVPARIVPDMHAMDGLFLAFRRPAIEQIGWDQETFNGFHCYDLDCTYRAYRAGLKLGVALDLHILHHSYGSYGDKWKFYSDALLQKHAATLERIGHRKYRHAIVEVPTKEEAMVIMREVCKLL